MSDSFITFDGGGAQQGDSPPSGNSEWCQEKKKEPLVSSGAQPAALIKGSEAAAANPLSSPVRQAQSRCWPGGKYPLKWLDYTRVMWSALMSNFDVACLVGPHSGLTIFFTCLTEHRPAKQAELYRASLQICWYMFISLCTIMSSSQFTVS